MECLSAGRNSLRRTKVRSLHICQSSRPLSPATRPYALAQTPRRMAHGQSAAKDNISEGSSGTTKSEQTYPLSGYYSLILNSPSPYHGRALVERSTEVQPESQPEDKPAPKTIAEAQTPQEKMAIVFGTRLAGPGRQSRYNPGEAPPISQWKTINGVPIPPRPEEPDNCCMSGCVNCVWDGFRDEMEEWAARIETAKAKGGPEKGTGDMRAAPRSEVNSASMSMDDDGGGSEANWPAPSQDDDLFSNIPVGIREFMKTEKKLKVKHEKEARV
ncbi:uncharacterized protein N7469_008838 [Penicillium citrinum]|uniref:Oxidoreductase-like domain-containing protein n=1 Tax=Penicillium citrinum TaxID=5077 RepID=A0A9W9NMS3_PENCI|nr:uncharacterized protein N7469_008838 [Penicillium citrinum]KAJ5222598.1 hypothetical protein N7469_008838 [Penicillium citrinum]